MLKTPAPAYKLVSGGETSRAVRELIGGSGWVCAAVAYWGEGAVKRLGLDVLRGRDVSIALDLRSGLCNPQEVARLREIVGQTAVRAVDRLHAKLWLSEGRGAVIGSSNASANGFGHEGKDEKVIGLIEANLQLRELSPSTQRAWRRWFDTKVWSKGEEVTPELLKQATELWKQRRNARDKIKFPPSGRRTVLQMMRASPGYVADKHFLIWAHPHQDPSEDAIALFSEVKEELSLAGTSPRGLYYYEVGRKEAARLTAGSYVLDCDWNREAKKLRYDGLWQVLRDKPLVRRGQTKIVLVRKATDFEGLKCDSRREWTAAVLQVMQHRKEREELDLTAHEFAMALLQSDA